MLLLACSIGWLDAQSKICILFVRTGFVVRDSTWHGKAGTFRIVFAAKT